MTRVCSLLSATGPIISQVRATETRHPSETCRDRAQSHLDCGDSQSSSRKRKGILTLKMTTVESVTNSDALKKSADTVAKAAFNKSDKGDFSPSMIISKAIFSEP